MRSEAEPFSQSRTRTMDMTRRLVTLPAAAALLVSSAVPSFADHHSGRHGGSGGWHGGGGGVSGSSWHGAGADWHNAGGGWHHGGHGGGWGVGPAIGLGV